MQYRPHRERNPPWICGAHARMSRPARHMRALATLPVLVRSTELGWAASLDTEPDLELAR